MKRFVRATAVLLCLVGSGCAVPASTPATGDVANDVERALSSGMETFDHAEWDALLRDGTRDGLVDYAYMARNRVRIDAYVDRIAAVQLGALERDELKALLINAYNVLTVVAILDNPDVGSIRDIDGVWSALLWSVGGHELTLDNIEHNLLRPFFKDPRIHFAVNCASRSCAPLPTWAFTASELEDQLEERARSFLRDSRNVALEGDRLHVSQYFDWYGEDFIAEGWMPRAGTIAEFIATYADDDVRAAVRSNPEISLEFEDYDWSLNSTSVAEGASANAKVVAFAGVLTLPQEAAGGIAGWVERLRAWVSGFGAAGPLVYGLVYVLAVVLLAPASALTIGAGVAFGLGLGTLTVVLAATIGASLAFLIGRYLLRTRVERWLSGRAKLSAVDRAVEKQGWRVVALTRLSPAFPFNVQNYFYGVTGVSFWQYAIASLIAMAPGTLLYVYIGVAGAEVAEAAGGAATWGQTALLIAGLVATLGVVVLITRVAKKELDKAVQDSGGIEADDAMAAPAQ